MFVSASLCYALIVTAPPAVESRFAQVAPVPPESVKVARNPNQARAVVLIHGYRPYASEAAVAHAEFRDWQKPTAALVKELARDSDVFSYGYGQNAAVGAIVASGGLADAVAQLRKAGYRDIVLVGHSAGALVARQFVEDNPDSGVTKLIQVCPPNGGTQAATIGSFASQRAFLDSLTVEGRQKCLKERAAKTVPGSYRMGVHPQQRRRRQRRPGPLRLPVDPRPPATGGTGRHLQSGPPICAARRQGHRSDRRGRAPGPPALEAGVRGQGQERAVQRELSGSPSSAFTRGLAGSTFRETTSTPALRYFSVGGNTTADSNTFPSLTTV